MVAEHRRMNHTFTMVVVRAEHVEGGARNKGVVAVGPQDEILECSRGDGWYDVWVNAGLYVLNTDLVRGWPPGTYSIEEHVSSPEAPPMHAFRSEGRLLDIGTPKCYELAHQALGGSDALMSVAHASERRAKSQAPWPITLG